MTTTPLPESRTRRPGHGWMLARHYAEMVVAMFVGMLVLGAVREMLGLTVPFAERPGPSFLLMATDMTIGMGLWMRLRGHSWVGTAQMCAAMYVPLVLLPLLWAGVLGAMAFMVLAHVVMMLAMLAVLLRQHAGQDAH